MDTDNKYLIDTNIFLESVHRFYAREICPGFWDWLEEVAKINKNIKSIKKVREEIEYID